jgi:hypothetical protein
MTPTEGETMTDLTRYRIAAWAGVLGMLGTIVNAARRAGVIPGTPLTHAIAPLAPALAVVVVVALYLYQRERLGVVGFVGFAATLLGVVGLFGVEFTTHAVFQFLPADQLAALTAGPTRGYLLAVAGTFAVGVILFGLAQLRARMLPAPPILVFILGWVAASLRGIVPDPVFLIGLVVGAAGTLWLSLALLLALSPRALPRPNAA